MCVLKDTMTSSSYKRIIAYKHSDQFLQVWLLRAAQKDRPIGQWRGNSLFLPAVFGILTLQARSCSLACITFLDAYKSSKFSKF